MSLTPQFLISRILIEQATVCYFIIGKYFMATPLRWRVANGQLVKIKVGPKYATNWEQARSSLAFVLEDNFLDLEKRRARAKGGTQATRKALFAAADLLGRVVDGRCCYLSGPYAKQTLQTPARILPKADAAVQEEYRHTSNDDSRPDWWRALLDLLILTRRSWIYLWLWSAHGTEWGYLGEFAEVYLGARARGSAIAGDKAAFANVERELRYSHDEISHGDTNKCAIRKLLKAINDQELDNAKECSWADLATRTLEATRAQRPESGYTSDDFPHLARALNVVGDHRDQGLPIAMAAQALHDEVAKPGGHFEAVNNNIGCLLEALDVCHTNENSIPDVLGSIAARTPVAAQQNVVKPKKRMGRGKRPVGRNELAIELYQYVASGDPIWAVLLPLSICWGIKNARDGITKRLPGPQDLIEISAIQDARSILADWNEKQDKIEGGALQIAFLEIPSEVIENLALIEPALNEVDEWIADPQNAPMKWSDVQVQIEPVLRAAVFAALLDSLSDHVSQACERLKAPP